MSAPITALVGLTCSGLVSGLTLAYPLLINTHFIDQQGAKIAPAALHVNLGIAQRLTLWERAFKAGYVVPALSLLTAVTLATFALNNDPSHDKTAFAKRVGSNWVQRKKTILASAALTGSLIVFTVLAIAPTNTKLMALRQTANNKEAVDVKQAEALLRKWTQLHNVRVSAALGGFVLALYSFVVL
ncbi:uncharacterized protein UMAG_04500 [Mycosarcoma maydis]|uniref:DUF1772-domain-containing protein n=1 Tax=Mycosarcoma maydis TaxID=5270 RepID=A0A0D1DY05_MYCMD|nr:uncharacterized protein UMAG_04500 [Ustilago maydis 521]KIS67400.1 hypothetical protein UMAG_04500 [Ustilago maydis 521]|eukprot:XP_011390834.1 hypothetical protein UMAG_04500 [Ustilago maydis 521]